jgi:hypothetical protein
LKAINDIIGTNKFILGNEACVEDSAVFGMLAQVLFHDFGPLNTFARGKIFLFLIAKFFIFLN